MRRWIGVSAVAAVALAAAAASSGQRAETASWGWSGTDSKGRQAAIALDRELPGSTVQIGYEYFDLCGDDGSVSATAPVAADGSFAFSGRPGESSADLTLELSGRFDGRSVSGTARMTVDPGDACPDGDSTGVATFRATCDPCGEPEPEDEGLKVVNPLTGPRVTPRLRANGLIAFVRGNRGGSRIMTVNARGGGARNVTNGKHDFDPSFSHDGRRIAFIRIESGRRRLYVVNRTGTGLRRLATGSGNAGEPDWSPDGKQIVFRRWTARTEALWLINANGTGLRRVTNDQAYATSPTWSPDGSALAVMYDNGILLIEGAKTRMLVRNAFFPAWSPDGKRIAYLDMGRGVLATVGVDGKGRKTIARPKVGDGMGEPAWSPDGRSIAFNRGYLPHPYQELTVVGANGGGSRRLTSNFDDDMQASWGAR
jgi:dipeptidyl aminopeptidase/acylaminoacyl peptidase